MTPEKIIELGEPVEHVYNCMVDELMTNCALHLRGATWTALHELETLENLGQLTKENAEIINYWAKKITPEMRSTMKHARDEALKKIEKKLAQAAKDGYVAKPLNDTSFDAIKAYYEQAVDKLNMVNTTMLQSSLQLYQSGAAKYQTVTARNYAAAQNAMNEEVGYVESGAKTRQEAMRDAIRYMASQGVTGFYDRAGRAWNAEAYVAMDMRTTIHNSMIAAVQARQEDYGTSVFQVSAHPAARPLCYPYQGKLYSWDNTAGDFPTGEGQKVHYAPLNTTSYGLPAGLFGINCGHTPYPMIPNVSIPADEEIQSPEENEKAYAESQKQRALEREIRYAKRDLEMLGSLATEEDKKRLAMAQANMRAFCAETGRARRYDREQIYTTFKRDDNPPPPSSPNNPNSPNIPPMSPPLQQAVQQAQQKAQETRPENEQDVLKQFNRYDEIRTGEEIVKMTNPHWHEARKWDINCQRCVVAEELQFRGYDVTAKAWANDPVDSNGKASWKFDGGYWFMDSEVKSTQKKDFLKDVADCFKEWGEGARAIIRVGWMQKYGGGGHVFFATEDHGQITYSDPQSGEWDFQISEYLSAASPKQGLMWIMRTDNRELEDIVTLAVENRKK